ncbi:Glutaredoxin [Streptococcus pyogenes MGAS10750]|nr:Glutaredoxin [Streptococcus pyogenes MGAS10750]
MEPLLILEGQDMITVYSKNNCMQCKMTKKFLEQHGANFQGN